MPDPVFRGMNRPALWRGVPFVVCVCTYIPALLLIRIVMIFWDSWQSILLIGLLLPLHLSLREVTLSRPQVWRQIGLWIVYRLLYRDCSTGFWRSSTYGPGGS